MLDLNTNRVLASVWYWNYGDYNPIAHHLCAFPSADPYGGFEFVNSTQGGKNCLIYGIPTNITEPAPGFNIYRVRYDGAQMQVMENVSKMMGLWAWRARHRQSEGRPVLFCHRWPEGHRRLLRSDHIAGQGRTEV